MITKSCSGISQSTNKNVRKKQIARSQQQLKGLSRSEVQARKASGKSNYFKLPTSRSYAQIFSENLFTFINVVFLVISCVFLVLKRPSDAFFVLVIIFSGIVISICQEIWAKRKLDRISLLTRPLETVIRDSQELLIEPEEIVQGDLLLLRPGDRILVDGQIVGGGPIDVDESLLTGESDLIPKTTGQFVYSGSICVNGSAYYEAQKVGTKTVAYQLTVAAREFRQNLTPLQREINSLIRTLSAVVCFLWFLLGIGFLMAPYSIEELVQRSAVIAGLIPVGLLVTITLAYVMGAVKMLKRNVLIQQTNAVESLSHVNLLCLDKTGTLTTNLMNLETIYSLGIAETKLRQCLGNYAVNTTSGNRTIEAILHSCPGEVIPIKTEVPFSSSRKWSAIVFDDSVYTGTYVLGAPEILSNSLSLDKEFWDYINRQVNQGLRVVLFARSRQEITPRENCSPRLPASLILLGVLSFTEQLRPCVRQTLQGFIQAGITIKIISGDHPDSVAKLFKQAGFTEEIKVISGQDLAQMDKIQFALAAIEHNVFGRVTPEQKAKLVQCFRDGDNYVAMIGDGVNDILSLKQANLAIAMESGSKATRAISDIVLLNDSFEALPHIFLEGQRIRNGICDVLKLFIIRLACVALLIVTSAMVTDIFPLRNRHSAIVSLIGMGIPSVFLPFWAKPSKQAKGSAIYSILHFILPVIVTITFVSLMVYLFFLSQVSDINLSFNPESFYVQYGIPRTALVTILVFCELLLIPFLKPPTTAWVAGEPLSSDWRYSITAAGLLIIFLSILFIPQLRDFFELSPLANIDYVFLGLIAIVWCLILRWIWRTRFLERFLGINFN